MEQKRVTPLTTAGCFAAIMLLFALLSTFVPVFSFFGYFIMPVPMTIIFMKYGLRYAVLLGVTVGVLMGIFIDPITALYQFIIFGSVGLALGAGFRNQWPAARLFGNGGGCLGRCLCPDLPLGVCRLGYQYLYSVQ